MIYLHVPFCRSFCTYCDFYSEVACKGRDEAAFARWADGVCEEIEARRQETLQPVTSGVWHRPGKWTAAEKYALEVSDVVSFHNYNSFDSIVREIALLRFLCGERIGVIAGMYGVSRFAMSRRIKDIQNRLKAYLGKEAQPWQGI